MGGGSSSPGVQRIGSSTVPGSAIREQHGKTVDDGKLSPAGRAGDIRTGELERAVADRADQPAEITLGEAGRLAGRGPGGWRRRHGSILRQGSGVATRDSATAIPWGHDFFHSGTRYGSKG